MIDRRPGREPGLGWHVEDRDDQVRLADRLDPTTRREIESVLETGALTKILPSERARIAATVIRAALDLPIWVKARPATALSWFIGEVNVCVEDADLLTDATARAFWAILLSPPRAT